MGKNRRFFARLLVLAALAGQPVALHGQSLADVARAEEARRKGLKIPAKVYTNDDLKEGVESSPAAPVTPPPTAQSGTTKPPAATAKPETEKPAPADDQPKKDEKYWKDRMNTLRTGLARNKILLDALQSRVNALNTDFANRADPAQRAVVEEDRKTALAEMERVKRDTEKLNKAMVDLEEEARRANVAPGWLR